MKRRFSKILGVGLTLALLTSLLLTAAPVSAVTTPVVTLIDGPVADTAGVISKENVYTVLFTTGAKVPANGEIVVVFEAGHEITGMTEANVEIQSTAGLGGVVIDDGQATPGPTAVFDAVVTGTYPAAQTLTITPSNAKIIGSGAIVELTIGSSAGAGVYVTNPDAAGTYNLTVATQESDETVIEAAVTSADYTIIVPTIAGLPGVASVYNSVGVLMAQTNTLGAAITAAGPNYTIYVGPGTYDDAATIDITHEGLTFVSTAGAATTIISGRTVWAINVAATDVTVDGFTVEAGGHGILIDAAAADATVKNNIITAESTNTTGIYVNGVGPTVTGNELDENCTIIVHNVSDGTISGNTLGECINLWPSTLIDGLTITDNTITSAAEAIDFFAGCVFTDVLIEGNTISGAEGSVWTSTPTAIVIRGTITNLRILDNEITDNEGVGILVDSSADTTTTDSAIAIKFNTITGNDADNDGYGIQNDADTDTDVVDATLNWWGTAVADDVAAMINDTETAGSVTIYEPFLADAVDAVFSASDVAVGEDSLDASTTVGVRVSEATDATVISVAKYIANPQAAIADAIAFYDVYVVGVTGTDPTVNIKFYAGDAQSDLYVWSADTEAWVDLSDDDSFGFSVYGGYMYIDYAADLLGGTPFAVVTGVAAEIDPPIIVAPDPGERDVPITPMFAWTQIAAADAYYFEFANNANFVLPLVSLTGDLGRLIVTAYAYVGELDYSTPYYWRVKAVSGTIEAGDLGESVWASGVFITMGEPVEPTPPIVVEEVEPPVIVIEQPDIIVPLPAETSITPAWIYVIIGVGAVLVIALLVLIVRTRRVA